MTHAIWPKRGLGVLGAQDVGAASRICIQMSLQLLWKAAQQKKELTEEILLAGELLRQRVELLLTIRGITPLSAIAFLADVADVKRFQSLRKMNAYLGLVPKCKDSEEKSRSGHINPESRKLARTILTQSLIHVTDASSHFRRFYDGLKWQKGAEKPSRAIDPQKPLSAVVLPITAAKFQIWQCRRPCNLQHRGTARRLCLAAPCRLCPNRSDAKHAAHYNAA
jgi:transposase